jgi:hypothetical protein
MRRLTIAQFNKIPGTNTSARFCFVILDSGFFISDFRVARLFRYMKALKLALAILAVLFVLFHLIEIPGKLGAVSGDFAFSWWMGKLAAILIGSAIAVALFRSAMSKQK